MTSSGKRVRYLAGAAGVLPMALAAPAAHAATAGLANAGVKTVTTGKTVSLHPAVGAIPLTPNCTTSKEGHFPATNSHIRGRFWYREHSGKVCIGTAEISLFYTKNITKWAKYIFSSAGFGAKSGKRSKAGTTGHWTEFTWSVNKTLTEDETTTISAFSQYSGGKHPIFRF
jgi:hypothetical protein